MIMQPDTASEILVFKTNIDNAEAAGRAGTLLTGATEVLRWNIDVQDIDHVLRVECTDALLPQAVIEVLNAAGFQCEELPD